MPGETEVVTVTIGSLLSSVGDIFTNAIGWVGEVASTITSNPILLLFCVLPLVGLGVGLFRRLINVN